MEIKDVFISYPGARGNFSNPLNRFHYDVIKKQYGDRAKLNFTDTDSFMYEILTEDVYNDMLEHKELYDLSDYPADHFLHDSTNNKVIGKFKDETKGEPIIEFIGLRPKMYSFLTMSMVNAQPELHEKHRAKGIQSAASARLRHEQYRQQLDLPYENYITNRRIGSAGHQIFAIETKKRGLCAMDNKRYITDDNYHTLAYGHHRIPVKINHLQPTDSDAGNVFSTEEAVREGIINPNGYHHTITFPPAGPDPAKWAEDQRNWHDQLERMKANLGPDKPYNEIFPNAKATIAEKEIEEDTFDDFLAMMADD